MNNKLIAFVSLVLVLTVAGVLFSLKDDPQNDLFFKSASDSLNCVIQINVRSSSAHGDGFSYELLRRYATETDKKIRILPADSSAWENLGKGLDIIVVNDADFSIPENFRNNVRVSIPVARNIVMVFSDKEQNLLNSVNFWLSSFKKSAVFESMCVRYFQSYKPENVFAMSRNDLRLSPYDDIIKKYSELAGLDWIMIASIAYQESRYHLSAKSEKEAHGLMQIKRTTAAAYGVEDLFDPEQNIKAGTLYFNHLVNMYRNETGLDSMNILKFALASYNAGESRIAKCRKYAFENGYNISSWDSVSDSFGSNPAFSGIQTKNYVNEVIDRYSKLKTVMESNPDEE